MDLLRGQDLEKYIFARGPVPVGIVRDWLAQLGDILDYLHSRNPPIVHRDVKPANLLLRLQDSKIFLLDFGAVKEIGTIGSTRIGAPDYMAPEQNRGEPLPASDLYALGPTALFLLSGKSPVEFIDFTPEGLRFNAAKIPNLSNNWIDAIAKVTSLNPRDRFPNAAAFIAAIDKL
jgi:serine/threonine-protein kinase